MESEIVGIIGNDSNFEFAYYNLLSLSYLHIAQRKSFEKNEIDLELFKNALEAAEKNKTYPNYSGWINYLKGTVLYLEGNKIPEEMIAQTHTAYSVFLIAFNNGLKERGCPDYMHDYLSAGASKKDKQHNLGNV